MNANAQNIINAFGKRWSERKAEQEELKKNQIYTQMLDYFIKTSQPQKPLEWQKPVVPSAPKQLPENLQKFIPFNEQIKTPEQMQAITSPQSEYERQLQNAQMLIAEASKLGGGYGSAARQLVEMRLSDTERRIKAQNDARKALEDKQAETAKGLAEAKQKKIKEVNQLYIDKDISKETHTALIKSIQDKGDYDLTGVELLEKEIKPQSVSMSDYVNKHSNWASIESAMNAWSKNDESLLQAKLNTRDKENDTLGKLEKERDKLVSRYNKLVKQYDEMSGITNPTPKQSIWITKYHISERDLGDKIDNIDRQIRDIERNNHNASSAVTTVHGGSNVNLSVPDALKELRSLRTILETQ